MPIDVEKNYDVVKEKIKSKKPVTTQIIYEFVKNLLQYEQDKDPDKRVSATKNAFSSQTAISEALVARENRIKFFAELCKELEKNLGDVTKFKAVLLKEQPAGSKDKKSIEYLNKLIKKLEKFSWNIEKATVISVEIKQAQPEQKKDTVNPLLTALGKNPLFQQVRQRAVTEPKIDVSKEASNTSVVTTTTTTSTPRKTM